MVYGKGVNNAPYKVVNQVFENGNSRQTWMCPYYKKWKDMLKRCYSKPFQKSRGTYKGCEVCDEWLIFTNFKSWMENLDWEGKELDKDIKGDGKIYSPETCLFVSKRINTFVEWSTNSRSTPRGVSWCKSKCKFRSYGRKDGKTVYLGQSDNAEDCHFMWLGHKIQLTKCLLSSDISVHDKIALEIYLEKLTSCNNNREVFKQ